jgi:hypothetical protein
MHRVNSGPDDHDDGRSTRGGLQVDVIWALAAGLVALAAAVWSLRLTSWVPGTPLELGGDSTFVAMQLRDIAEHGWYWFNDDLGYPFGQNGSLFPELNVLHVALVKALGVFTPDPFTPGVVYFILGYPLAAVAMYVLARSQGLAPLAGVLTGVLFACAPGHQVRFGHLWLASYWVVPLGVWVALEVMRGRPLLTHRRGRTGVHIWLGPRTAATVAALLAVGLSGVYYVAFTVILLAVATVARRWREDSARGWVPGVAAAGFLVAALAVPLALARLSARSEVVTGRVPASRTFSDSEAFAGRFMELVLPWSGHRLDPLAFLTSVYEAAGRPPGETAALGIVGVVGCVALLVVTMRALVTNERPDADLRRWAGLSLIVALFYTVGGAGVFVAFFVTPQVRTWSRLSIYLLLFGLLTVGWGLTRLERRHGQTPTGLLVGALVIVGILDQTNPAKAPDHQAVAAHFQDLRAYTSTVQQATSAGCPVFQLPVVPFPESAGRGEMTGYDHLLPYLASDDLKFSAGAMRGTASADWQLGIDLADPRGLASQLSAAGFCAVEVNSDGFTPGTDPTSALAAALGDPIATTEDGVLVAFALPRSVDDESLRTRLLEPVTVALDAYPVPADSSGDDIAQWMRTNTFLRTVNLTNDPVPVTVALDVAAAGPRERTLTVLDEQDSEVFRTTVMPDRKAPVRLEFVSTPGVSRLRIHLSGDPVYLDGPALTASGSASNVTAASDSTVRVVSIQDQVRTGAVVP